MRQIRTFVVKIIVDEATPDQWHGQITEPSDPLEWRMTFSGAAELCAVVQHRIEIDRLSHREETA
jgi:hypothetical protein